MHWCGVKWFRLLLVSLQKLAVITTIALEVDEGHRHLPFSDFDWEGGGGLKVGGFEIKMDTAPDP
jgi:hypothetical protein